MKEATKTAWSARVAEWKQSGKTADEFAADKPYKGSTLVWRAWQLRRGKGDGARKERVRARPMSNPAEPEIRLAEVVRRAPKKAAAASVTVELVGARISVHHGFDPKLLREVVQALRGER
jgi:hypothetical protein